LWIGKPFRLDDRSGIELINATTRALISQGTAYIIVPKPRIVLSAKMVVMVTIVAMPNTPNAFFVSDARLKKTHQSTLKPAQTPHNSCIRPAPEGIIKGRSVTLLGR
jgi:hypothetical protein